jgi:beta-glucanase (GH16 family)
MSGTHSKRTPRRRVLIAVLSTLGLAAGAAAAVTLPANASPPPPPAGWTQVFVDDFNGAAGSGVNTDNWQYATGTGYPGGPANWGTGEIETMTDSTDNVSLDGNGNLRITPRRDASGNWTSGRIETNRTDFEPPAGGKLRVEGRMQVPNVTGAAAKGYWPAFWMLGEPYRGNYQNWPSVGELDIMENTQGQNTVFATMHCGTSPGGPCNENTGIGSSTPCPGTACTAGFHTYAVEWDRSAGTEEIRFSVDGSNFHTVREDQVDATTWTNATDHGFFIILNVAMGGAFPNAHGGGPDSGTEPGHPLVVDYVEVLQSAG